MTNAEIDKILSEIVHPDALGFYQSNAVYNTFRKFADVVVSLRQKETKENDIDTATVGEVGIWGEIRPCKTHPDAPHGFDRNASHREDRYVCECESWEPPPEPQPVAWLSAFTNDDNETIGYTLWRKDVGYNCFPVYRKPPKREWVGLTDDEYAHEQQEAWNESNVVDGFNTGEYSQVLWKRIEAKLKEKNT